MATVPVHINGREFQLACEDGQEELLIALAQEVDDRVRGLSRAMPGANESVLLLLAAVTLADELSDERRTVRRLQAERNQVQNHQENQELQEGQARLTEMEAAMAGTLKEVSERIERIARQLKEG